MPNTILDEQTAAEFREYLTGKLGNLNLTDKQLDSIVAKVDANNDGKISDEEFDNRMAGSNRSCRVKKMIRTKNRNLTLTVLTLTTLILTTQNQQKKSRQSLTR